ncbi:hypothetical protein BAUCODRAFT_33663 [Baudoinia panamericana UAMH 10762]|uniref:[histone H3]-trimethyl-L-lysine(9) demethylase n=1 Tax=Baudoinia panamericana (strain UAMH 10762) TaxID=717646 RepID=M2MXN1_BAUPA|nr:uncharacterized protein BAUCODRAFT_33663 [Baudoinia panamericana UAMH 10762]EMC96328.1 hypothetical protein BAUCODRAFT_33663 [Baudoinia panamericana UAMH 10762]
MAANAGTPPEGPMDPTMVPITSPDSMRDVKTSSEPAASKPQQPTSALTPPTSEEMDHEEHKKTHEESDLSDLDLDDDEEDIEPDHYWDGGKIPVFKPTLEQFKSFPKFIEKIDKYGMKSGIVKVIPPKEWRDSLPALDEYVKRIRIKNPITQEFNGTFGTYTQQNVEKQRSYNLPEWKALTEETQHQPPAKRGERRRNQEKVVRGGGHLRGRGAAAAETSKEQDDSPRAKKKPGRPSRRTTQKPAANDEDTPACAATPPAKAKPGRKPKGAAQGKPGQAKSVTSRRLNNTAESVDYVDEEAFKNFDYHLDDVDEYTPERCAELETHYWKSLAFNQPMYAADMPGSLFDDTVASWNVAKLENLLDVLGTKVPGVNTAYLYMGMWKATFAWHLEDVDLYSINYIHFGAPKQWYSISQEDARKFEAAMRQIWPMDSKTCDQFLRHKTYLISPDVLLKQYGVKVNKLVHYEGEFVITYPYGYHSGFNLGYNCAESVNFATESWLEFGRIARKCNCEADNVWVDVSEIERKLRGEPTPEYYEETDDDTEDEDGNLPTPPASVKGKAPRSRKRKRDMKEEKPKKKKKIRIRIRAPTREPCVMCPNDNPWEPLLPTDTGKKAHRACALYTPETWIERDEAGEEKVYGVAGIDRARLELKCNFCRSKRGACFQCSSKKCTRAFHATCAAAAGVLVDAGMVPTFGEDGTEYFEEGYDFRCKYHRPRMEKSITVEKIEANSKRVEKYGRELKFNDVVQAQYIGAEVFAGLVVENRPSELSVVVDVLPEGDRVEVEYKWLSLLHPDDSQRPKPSAIAIPMPQGMNKKAVSVNNRQDGVPTQGEAFHENPEYKWHDFYNMHMPPPDYTSKLLQTIGKLEVKIDASDTLYYYLPKASTESKCFFTDNAGSKVAAPKGNFLDRVSKPAHHYVAQRQQQLVAAQQPKPLLHARPQPAYQAPQTGPTSIGNPANRSDRPYAYQPKEPTRPNVLWGVDQKALETQRSFLADAERRSSQQQYSLPQPKPQHNYQGSDPVRNAPLRPFARELYYSTATLPAAYPGEYSGFTQVVRRQSNGALGAPRPGSETADFTPSYQPVSAQRKEIKRGAPTVPAMGGSMPPNSYSGSSSSRPSSSAQSGQSPAGAPLTPATTVSSAVTKTSETTPPGYLDNLQKYPYLKNSFLRRTAYISPYATDDGFSESYQPLTLDQQPAEEQGLHTPTPCTTAFGFDNGGRPVSHQWTPPSQLWHTTSNSEQPQSPPRQLQTLPAPQYMHQPQPRQFPQPTYQTPLEFRQSFSSLPSAASRDGAQARMLRDQGFGYSPYASTNYAPRQPRGSQYDTARMWDSPKAPTPSPLSDQHGTPGVYNNSHTPTHNSGWGPAGPPAPILGGIPMQQQGSNGSVGHGPTLPQMAGGSETWRYN